MRIIVIAKLADIKNKLIGVRMYDVDVKIIKDVPLNNFISVVGANKVKIENIEIDNMGKLKGVGGNLDRYAELLINGDVKNKNAVYLLNKTDEYIDIVDYNGKENRIDKDKFISMCVNGLIKPVNGKVIQRNGEWILSAISREIKRDEMVELVDKLNKAIYAYEIENREIMSNYEYDRLYDKLQKMERETGRVLPNSPTVNVGSKAIEFKSVSKLEKEKHKTPMLSLDKTKEIERLKSFLGSKTGMLSWKLDGLTVVATYNNGKLQKAVTRGTGEVGEIVTHNAVHFKNLPLRIEFKGELVVRGEAIITYSNFDRINKKLPVESKYKNPRNLSSGSVRQLDSKISADRGVEYYAFELVSMNGRSVDTVEEGINILNRLGFKFVESYKVTSNNIENTIKSLSVKIKSMDIPSDGLVLTYNDVAYGKSLGSTSKFPKHSIAYKWTDEVAVTVLREIEWSPSRTGLINPIAIFDPVELEGTTVSRASLHNVSIVKELKLGIGDKIKVYKANMIIPQVSENITQSGNAVKPPSKCPACGHDTKVTLMDESYALFCLNENCPAKGVKLYKHFVTRDAMNIDGLSEATLQRFVDEGFINEVSDIYKLSNYKNQIISMDGFGQRSYEKMIKAIDKSRNVKLANLIYAVGVPNVGLSTAKLICERFDNDLEKTVTASYNSLINIDGIGEVIAKSFYDYFRDKKKAEEFVRLVKQINIVKEDTIKGSKFNGMTFCVTGSVEIFNNRREIKEIIEKNGGKLSSSVSKSTDYLITNDTSSGSSKNKKAAEYGTTIISEREFIDMFELEI